MRRRDHEKRKRSLSAGFAATVAAPVRRDALVGDVAAAAGRASPKIDYRDADFDSVKESAKAPSVEEALEQGRLILLAEDHPTSRQVILRQLNLLGYAADVVNDGSEAFAAWQEKPYALVLTDCHMPKMDGFDLTRRIRKKEEGTGAHVPIIAATASAIREEADRCFAVGMDDHLTKPIELTSLKRVLRIWMPAAAPRTGDDDPIGPEPSAPASSEAAKDGPVDTSVLAGLFGDDPDVIRKMLTEFVSAGRRTHRELEEAIAARSAKAVAEAAHKIKGASRIAGAMDLAALGSSLEAAGRNKLWPEIERLAPRLEESLQAVEEFVSGMAKPAEK